jgi:hypothetical protein
MAGLTRKLLVLTGVAIAMLLLPAAVAVAQEQYPPVPPSVDANTVSVGGKTASVDDPAKALAFTGSSDTMPTVWVAAGLVVFGGALVFVARQRRTASNRS